MALVVFLRGVNVGGQRTFRPSVLARDLAEWGVVNVGAAGTFVARKATGPRALRAEFLRRLPFHTEVVICAGRDVIDLASADPFPDEPAIKPAHRYVSVMAARPRTLPPLPIWYPAGDLWETKVLGVRGRFAYSFWRHLGGRSFVIPNEVVERNLGVVATARNWNTICALRDILVGG
jgi:uncharacterized protein (DUF1697 family)